MANSVDPDQTAQEQSNRIMRPKDADGMANSVDPDQTARGSLIESCVKKMRTEWQTV